VDESELLLSFLGKRWRFPKAKILRLSSHDSLFSDGLRIEHGVEQHPEFIVFWSLHFADLKRELEHRAYTVQEKAES
jgi:hypothetical protein